MGGCGLAFLFECLFCSSHGALASSHFFVQAHNEGYFAYHFSPPLHSNIIFLREWPTVPQLFVAGEFVGGCDIMTSLFQSGELAQILEETVKQQKEQKEGGKA